MRHWGNLESDTMYIVDLVQEPSGERFVHIRLPEEQPHVNAALQSNQYPGAALREFGFARCLSPEITTTENQQFGLDPHNLWMVREEVEYLKQHGSRDAVQPPWVNGIPPRFAPA